MLFISKDKNNAHYNRPLYGLAGEYTLAEGVSLPYFITLMTIDRVINELRVVEQVPASLEAKWSLKELFQREIDEDRVRQDIVKGYLLDSKKLKFFNAITIVLMPKGKDEKIQDVFQELEDTINPPIPWDATDQEDAQWTHTDAIVSNFGGVQFIKIGESARLRWNENFVLAVAVDGQHRLWALRTFREDEKSRAGTLHPVEQQTRIPVIFVLLHPDAGFLNKQDNLNHSIRSISRELFTDLNKNAKTVDRARELILDDRSIHARCVRTLLTDSTTQDSKDLFPLSLVRWQDDQNRFDSSYYLNSLVHLDLLVKALLNLKEPSDPMDQKQVQSFIKDINSSLGINEEEVEHDGRTLSQYYKEDCCDEEGEPQIPFSRLPENYLASAVEGFKINFQPWLMKLLLEFKPYKNLLLYAREHDLIEGAFGKFQAQTSKHKAIIKEQEITKDSDWYSREIISHQVAISSMKEEQWAFKAIFQKAIVRLGRIVEFEYRGEDKNLKNIDDILIFLDQLYDRNILKISALLPNYSFRLWTFIAINPGNDKIKVAKAVEDRILAILCLWYFGNRKMKIDIDNDNPKLSRRKLLKYFSADTNKTYWPGCSDYYKTLYAGFNTNAFYGKDHEELGEDKKKELVRDRFSAILAVGIPELANYLIDEKSLNEENLELEV
ncbi:DNA sulfur modification protein DndB [Spirulina sp. 06S082]|uniref:DNA sulfur modification protein DndB n=1 Tax=Spirulina sp. 06S082 TaxID=3110248 RepID=UPI002B21CC75|nr:DNA sulfur modification protein DndB [Spirulina sp. 06S082]MEA5468920.1 DNA sulfur modification protein DndB [Spirulina sp. 06S082]